jgi:hypothetical protein
VGGYIYVRIQNIGNETVYTREVTHLITREVKRVPKPPFRPCNRSTEARRQQARRKSACSGAVKAALVGASGSSKEEIGDGFKQGDRFNQDSVEKSKCQAEVLFPRASTAL